MKRGQLKIQQMAFVLVAIMIFFGFVALFYFSVRIGTLEGSVEDLREQEVKESVRKMTGVGEFAWTVDDCSACVDLDKVLALSEREAYEDFWGVPFLQVVRVYPSFEGECTRENYPRCGQITLVDSGANSVAHSAFVALCRHESSESYNKCELGKIIMGFETVR